jgi:Tfp pilus assembly protein PilO
MAAQLPVRKAAAKMLVVIQSLDFSQLRTHSGLNFEKLRGMVEPGTGEQLYSLRVTGSVRVTGSARAIACLIKGPALVLVSLHIQHDKAYRK